MIEEDRTEEEGADAPGDEWLQRWNRLALRAFPNGARKKASISLIQRATWAAHAPLLFADLIPFMAAGGSI